jgi:hypothetical protein
LGAWGGRGAADRVQLTARPSRIERSDSAGAGAGPQFGARNTVPYRQRRATGADLALSAHRLAADRRAKPEDAGLRIAGESKVAGARLRRYCQEGAPMAILIPVPESGQSGGAWAGSPRVTLWPAPRRSQRVVQIEEKPRDARGLSA